MTEIRDRRLHIVAFFDSQKSFTFSFHPKIFFIAIGIALSLPLLCGVGIFVLKKNYAELKLQSVSLKNLKAQVIASHLAQNSKMDTDAIAQMILAQSESVGKVPEAEKRQTAIELAAKSSAMEDLSPRPPTVVAEVRAPAPAVTPVVKNDALQVAKPIRVSQRAASQIEFSELVLEENEVGGTDAYFTAKSVRGNTLKGKFCLIATNSELKSTLFPGGHAIVASEALKSCSQGISTKFSRIRPVTIPIYFDMDEITRLKVLFFPKSRDAAELQEYSF